MATAYWLLAPQSRQSVAAGPPPADTVRQPTRTASRPRSVGVPSAEDWPMYRRGPDQSGHHPRLTAVDHTTVGKLVQRWRTRIPGTTSPAVAAGGAIYVGAKDRHLYALDAVSGAIRWRYAASGTVVSAPSLVENRVVFTASDGTLTALETRRGHRMWTYAAGYGASAPTITTPGPGKARPWIYVGSNRGTVDALDLDGRLKWSYRTGGPVASSPAVVSGTVYVGSADKKVHALDATTGARRWQAPTAGNVTATPAIHHGTVYVGSTDSMMYALNARSGRPLWTHRTYGPLRSAGAVAPGRGRTAGTVYIGSDDGNLYAFDASRGSTRWKTALKPATAPAHANGLLFVGTASSTVVLDARSGHRLWASPTTGAANTAPILARGHLIVSAVDGHLYAFALPGHPTGPPPPLSGPETPSTPVPPTATPAPSSPRRPPAAISKPMDVMSPPLGSPPGQRNPAACPLPPTPAPQGQRTSPTS
ncbi:Serine/threonine-protein kinase AfsK (plasmid) [Streptomyces sp. YIM 121038]|nr:Serine/threonine-protein kinase AfsK [Streptomyces sp. YIM 121038]